MSLKLAAGVVVIAGVFISGMKVEHDRIMRQWNAEKLQAAEQAEQNRILRQAAVNKPAKVYAEKAAKSRDTVQSNLTKVDQYAPATFPPLPGSFRVWHDAAAADEALNPASGIDAASVSLREASTRIAGNYTSANYDKHRLIALQEIVRASGCFDVE